MEGNVKRIALLLTILILIPALVLTAGAIRTEAFPRSAAHAGVADLPPIDYTSGVLPIMAFRYDDGGLFSIGIAKYVGDGLWTIPFVDVGHYGTLGGEVAKIWELSPAFSAGLLAGPAVDWIETGPSTDPLVYLTGAGGALATWRFSGEWYAVGWMKYKFSFEQENLYQNGWQAGIGLGYWFTWPLQ